MPSPSPQADSSDERALFEVLNAKFRASLRRYFVRRGADGGGAFDVDDMVQEVFERLLKRRAVHDVEHLSRYVFETASSVVTDRHRWSRSHRLNAHDPFDAQVHADVDFSPERVLLAREQLAKVGEILLELPERTRVVFVLRRLEGKRNGEIAAQLGISVSAIEKHMQRAMSHLLQRTGEAS